MHSTAPASSGILTLSLPSGHLLVLKQQHQHGWQHPDPHAHPGMGSGIQPRAVGTQRGDSKRDVSTGAIPGQGSGEAA